VAALETAGLQLMGKFTIGLIYLKFWEI